MGVQREKRNGSTSATPIQTALMDLFRRVQSIDPRSVNAIHQDTKIDRRRLKDLMAGTARSISFRDLDALNRYFAAYGLPLNGVLETSSLLQSLVRGPSPTFLFGARNEGMGLGVSWWDTSALSFLVRAMNGVAEGGSTSWDIEDVPIEPSASTLSATNYAERFASRPWFHLLDDDANETVLSFASPVANHAAELMLATMFGVPPFRPADAAPFQFVWGPKRYESFPSAFAIDGSTARDLPAKAKRDERSAWAMRIDGEYFWGDRTHPRTSTFGIIAAQRRARGQLWIVVAGLTGPATYAASRFLTELPDVPDAGTVWIPIQAEVPPHEPPSSQQVSAPRSLDGPSPPVFRMGPRPSSLP